MPGFQFKTREAAEAFQKYVSKGDTEGVKEQAQARRDAYADDRSQTAVERLTEMADKLEESADESLGRDRKANTSRRAGMAARAEANANSDKAMAKTMRNIAQAIQDGSAKFLDRVRQKAQVAELASIVGVANYAKLREQYPDSLEKHRHDPPTIETADHVEFPTYTAYRSNLAKLGRQLLEQDGTKLIGKRLMTVADDVTDAYLTFAKENLHKVSSFTTKDGALAVLPTKARAEEAIQRGGFRGQATTVSFKRGEHLIILSPSEAQSRGIWDGDDDKRITLSQDFGAEIVEKAGKNIDVPWHFETTRDRLKRLAGMGIETPAELRAAAREYIGLREAPKAADKVKELERAMIGRKNDGMDFFPTPEATADEMVQAAGIEPGMKVLEPSAGWGHIAERIRAAGVEPDVVEMSSDRQELLEAKGFNVVGRDFLDVGRSSTVSLQKELDALLERRESIREKQMARFHEGSATRARTTTGNADADRVNEQIISLRKQIKEEDGGATGYDRIIMNPPFSDRRDAEHVQHAYSLLNPGGRLVAIMGEGVFFGKDKKAQAFREWLESVGGTDEKLEQGTFLDPALPVNTGVNSRMVVIEKETDKGVALYSKGKATGTTTAQVETELRTFLKRGYDKLTGSGKLRVVQSVAELPSVGEDGIMPSMNRNSGTGDIPTESKPDMPDGGVVIKGKAPDGGVLSVVAANRGGNRIGSGEAFLSDDGELILDGERYRPGEKAYLFGGKFYRTPPHGLIDKTKNVIDSATGLLDSLKKTMWQIKWKEPKTVTIKKGENYTNLFGMEDIAEQDTDARNEKRYDGVDTNLYNQIDRVESLVDRPDVDALLKSLYQKELENYVFTVGGYLHIPSGNSEQLTKAQITAIERYVDNGGTLGASIIRALGDKEKIDAAIVAHPAAQESLAKEPKKRIKPFPNLNSPPSDGGDVTHLYSKDGSIAGVYDPNTGKIILVADNIKNGQAAQVMLHEGLHKIMREDQIFSKQHDAILSQFEAKRKYDYRVQDAFRRVPSDTPAHLVNEEALAYFIENKANHETSLFKKILANIRMWLMRMGIPMKNLTTDDLVAMVVQGVRRMANQERVADAGKTMEGELAPASYPMFSKAASLENLEEVAKTMGSITVKKRAKVDSTMLDRIFSTPEYYFNKASESAGRVLQAALLRRDVRFTKEQEILGKEFIGYVQSLRKSNPEAYAEANDYLVDQDQSGEGFSLKEEGETWKVIGQDGKMVSRHDTEQEAVAAMVEAEAAQLEKNGYSSDAIQAVKLARELTNRGFDVMAADMRKIIAEAKEAGLPNPMIGDGALDESGRYGIYGAHSKKPIALFATEQQANEAMDRAAQMISYVVQIRGGGERSFMSEVKANAWAKKHSGTVNGRKTFDGLTVRMRTDVEMRPMTVQQALAQMGDMRGTYFPRIRKPGEYVLIAKKDGHNPIRKSFDLPMSGGEDETVSGDKLSGWQKAFNLTTPMGREATRLARLGYNISMDRDTHPVDDMFSGTNLTTTIDAILQDSMAVIDKNNQSDIKAGQQINQLITMQVADIFKARGYLSSRLKRMSGDVVWEGYEADMGKALTQYGKGIAAGTAKRDTARSMVLAFSGRDYSWDDYKQEVDKPVWSDYQEIVEQRRIDPRRQKNLFVDVRAFMIDVLRNDEKTDRIIGTMKGLAVLKFLAFRVSSAAVNATNMVTGVPATLAGHAGISLGKAGAHIGKAVSAYTKYRTGKGEMSEADRAIFQEITDRGWDDAQFNQEAARELRGELGEAWNKIMTAGMFMFGAVEKANRATTLFAAYKAMAEKHPNLAAEQIWTKAKEVSDRAHGVYGKETRPAWTRGGDFNRLLALPYTFTKFSHNYMLNMIDLGYTRKEYKAAAYLLLSPAVLAGAGATVATPALMALASALGIGGDDPEEEYYKWAEDTFGGGTFARHGLAGLAGVNLKGSLQVNNPMPTKLSELAGAPGAIVTDTWKAIQHFGRGEMAKGAEALLPTGFGSMSKSLREGSEGITTGSYGQVFYGDEPLKADNLDMALRFFSFNPARISGIREKQWNEKEVLASYQERKKDIYAKIKRLQIQGKGITPEVNKEIVRYNELAKGSGRGDIKPITPKNIRLMLKLNSRASKFERDRAANE
ncbi:MAG: hypothetical protein OEV91_02520 [Desulfobulbaceae bacterium]|nr:hypothetical protein [Desulfobulbaceae bacterium]